VHRKASGACGYQEHGFDFQEAIHLVERGIDDSQGEGDTAKVAGFTFTLPFATPQLSVYLHYVVVSSTVVFSSTTHKDNGNDPFTSGRYKRPH
jgi:hypothetical protein